MTPGRLRGVAGLAMAGLLVTAAGCGGDGRSHGPGLVSDLKPRPAARPGPPCPPAAPTSGALVAGLIVPDPQALHGVRAAAPVVLGAGPGPLAADGYQGGARRTWTGTTGQPSATIELLEFSCPNGAEAWAAARAAGGYAIAGPAPFAVAGLAGAQGERATRKAPAGYEQVVGTAVGTVYAEVTTWTPEAADGSLAGTLATEQADDLAPV